MDIFILVLLVKTLRINTTLLRIILSAFFGSMWVCIIMTLKINKALEMFFSYIVITFIMVKIVAYTYEFKKILKTMILLYVVTFAVGGMAHFLYYYTYAGYVFETVISGTSGLLLMVLASILIFAIVKGVIEQYAMYGKKVFDVDIVKGKTKISVKALYDSGNTLKDPLFNKPVNIVEKDKLQRIIEKNMDMVDLHYRLVAYNSLGNSHGILPVIDVDYICIYKENERVIINKAAVAIYDGSLNKNGAYSMLLNSVISDENQEE